MDYYAGLVPDDVIEERSFTELGCQIIEVEAGLRVSETNLVKLGEGDYVMAVRSFSRGGHTYWFRAADPFRQGGGKAFTKADRSRFLEALEREMRSAARG